MTINRSGGVRCGISVSSLPCYILSYTSQEAGLLVKVTSLPTYIPLNLTPVKWVTSTRSGGVRWGILIISPTCYILSYTSQEAGLLVHITSLPAYIILQLAQVNGVTTTMSGSVWFRI